MAKIEDPESVGIRQYSAPNPNVYRQKGIRTMSSATASATSTTACSDLDEALFRSTLQTPAEFMTEEELASFRLVWRLQKEGEQQQVATSEDENLAWAAYYELNPAYIGDTKTDGLAETVRVQQLDEEEQKSSARIPIRGLAVPGATLNTDNSVTILGKRYVGKECGSGYGGDSNMCFYMSVCDGNGAQAAALKARLAPKANETSSDIRYDQQEIMADERVVMALVLVDHTPVFVADRSTGKIMQYADDTCIDRPAVFLYFTGGHYQRLVDA